MSRQALPCAKPNWPTWLPNYLPVASHIPLYTQPCTIFPIWACLYHYCGPGSGMSLTVMTHYRRRKCLAGPGKLSACEKKTQTRCCLSVLWVWDRSGPRAWAQVQTIRTTSPCLCNADLCVIKSRTSDGQGNLALYKSNAMTMAMQFILKILQTL